MMGELAPTTRREKPLSGKLPRRHEHRWSRSNRQQTGKRKYAMEQPMTTDKIQFTKEKETMLMTLSGRAIQSQWKNPILRDPWAEEAMRHIDYDLSKQLKGVASWSMWKDIGPTIIATRAATFDLLTTRFLADHPEATVLHVGCGMATFTRAPNSGPQGLFT